jgi:catechol 2,3-dioxygenase-like lactoylglutathione lyase family enzyme
MSTDLLGIHHVTAITSDTQRNVDFYTGLLGMRLVKVTVNFDDPGSYHLYYGDEIGHPGTILTFFAWPGAPRGRPGTGQLSAVAFTIPQTSLDYWSQRLRSGGIQHQGPSTSLGESVLLLHDPDGMAIQLVAHPRAQERPGWPGGPIPAEHAIRGVHGVTVWEEGYEHTARHLTETLGFHLVAEEQNVSRYEVGAGGPGALITVRCAPEFPRGTIAAGSIHHVAWRTATDAQQQTWREVLSSQGENVTPILDRQYFHSIYFREPGGVLFEIATDPPGFTIDEPVEHLGSQLKLPPWLEPARKEIEQDLPPFPHTI